MNQIILQKDEKRLIGVMLGVPSDVIPAEAGIKDKILNQVENDKGGDRVAEFMVSLSNPLAMTSNRLDVVLAGENSEIEVVGLLLAKGESQTAFEVYITHAAPKTKSRVIVKSVLRNRSTFAFRGNVKIEKGAKGADAYLRSDALLFDDAKMGDDTPALEILEKDVKAGHAATIGKVDEVMLFYLMLMSFAKNLKETKNITLEITPDLAQLVATKGYVVAFGARPIKRLIQDKIEDQIAKLLISGKLGNGDTMPAQTLLQFLS